MLCCWGYKVFVALKNQEVFVGCLSLLRRCRRRGATCGGRGARDQRGMVVVRDQGGRVGGKGMEGSVGQRGLGKGGERAAGHPNAHQCVLEKRRKCGTNSGGRPGSSRDPAGVLAQRGAPIHMRGAGPLRRRARTRARGPRGPVPRVGGPVPEPQARRTSLVADLWFGEMVSRAGACCEAVVGWDEQAYVAPRARACFRAPRQPPVLQVVAEHRQI